MPTPRVYHTLYNCIVESYGDVSTLKLKLCATLGVSVRYESIGQATSELINYYKYHGDIRQLIRFVKDECPDVDRRKAFGNTLSVANTIAVSITQINRTILDKLTKMTLSPNIEYLHEKISFKGDINLYHFELANILDRCGAHVVIVGDPGQEGVPPLPFQIEYYCSFFWDLRTYFLIPKGREEEWRERIHKMIPHPQRQSRIDIRVYAIDDDLLAKFSDLPFEPKLRDPWLSSIQTPVQLKRERNEFDVFLCHNSKDKPAVKKIGEELKRRGILPWLDEWELVPGFPWQRELEKQIEKVKSGAVFVGQNGIGPWENMEQEAFLRQFVKRGCPVIPVILSDCQQEPKLPVFLESMTWVDFRKSDPDPMEQLIWGITGKRGQD